jgi:5-methylcytosine-specific restriction endonuclease McrA
MSNTAGSKWIRPAKRLSIYARDGFACVYCGCSADDSRCKLSLDHIVPRELGGTHEASNLVTSCIACNSARRDLPMRAWLKTLRSRGVRTEGLAAKIRRLTTKTLDMDLGRRLLSARRCA